MIRGMRGAFPQVSNVEPLLGLAVASEDWWREAGWSALVRRRFLCGAVEPVGQHGGGGLPREPWIVAIEHEHQTSDFPCPPRRGPLPAEKEGAAMDVVHARCAGIDISKRDAKVCVRIASAGRGRATSTVTPWGAVTNQVLALRDHL